MEEFDLTSIWPKYGLQDTPYFTSPLRLFGPLNIEKVFANREKEIQELITNVCSASSTRTLVVGDPGVGKTTYGNYFRWCLCIKNASHNVFLTTPAELKVQDNWDSKQFLRASLAAIYNANIVFDWKKQGVDIRSFKELEGYIKATIQKTGGVNAQVMGSGGGLEYGETLTLPSEVSAEILEDFFLRIMKEIREQGKQLILQYNNLENVENEKLSHLFRSVREYLQVDGVHTIFLGPAESLSAVERYSQVHSVFSTPIFLEHLNASQVLDILKKRCGALKIPKGRYIPPYMDETIIELHKILNGNIRLIFKILDDVTKSFCRDAPYRLSLKEIRSFSVEESNRKFQDLTPNGQKVLSALLDKGELSQKKLSEITEIKSANLSNNELPLLKRKGLIVVHTNPDDRRYNIIKPSENAQLIFSFSREKMWTP